MAGHGDHRCRFVADFVDDQTENDDTDGEWPEANAEDSAFVSFTQAEVTLPVPDDVGAQTEHERGRDERNEAGPEKLFVFAVGGGDGVGFTHNDKRQTRFDAWLASKANQTGGIVKKESCLATLYRSVNLAMDTGPGDTEKIRPFCLSKSTGLVNETAYASNQRAAGLIC